MEFSTISIILISIFIAVFCGIIFRYATKETTFEEIYGKNCRRMLNDDKIKIKSKSTKSKKTVKSGEKDKTSAEVFQNKSEQLMPNKVEKLKTKNEVDILPEQKDITSKKTKNFDDFVIKKNKKKDSVKSNNESSDSSLEKVETEMVLQLETIEAKKKSITNKAALTNITFNNLMERLKELDNLEPEYLTALKRFNETNNTKETKLNETTNLLKKDLNEKERVLKQTVNELANAQNKITQLQSELKALQENYETFESTVRFKLADSIKLKDENKRLTTLLSQSAAKDAQYKLISNEIEVLRKELIEKSLIANELAENKKLIETLQNKNVEMANICRDVIAAKNTAEKNLATVKQNCEKLTLKEQELHIAQQNLVETSSVLNQANNSVKELNKMLNEKVELVQLMKLQNDQLLTERNSLSQEIENLKSNNHVVEEKLKRIILNNEQYIKEIEELNIKNSKLINIRNKFEEEKSFNNKLEEEKQNLLEKINVLELKINSLEDIQEKLTKESKERAKSEVLYNELKKKLSREVEEHAKLESFTNELKKKFTQESNERAKLEVLINELEEKLKKKNEEHDKLIETYKINLKKLEIAEKKLIDFEAYCQKTIADEEKLKILEAKYNELEIELNSLKESSKLNLTNDKDNYEKIWQKKLTEQTNRIQDLRDKNFKLLEIIKLQENKNLKTETVNENKVWSNVVKFIDASFENLLDKKILTDLNAECYSEKDFQNWVSNCVEILKKKFLLNITNNNVNDSEGIEELKNQLKNYSNAFDSIKKQLCNVETLAEEVDKCQKAKIAELEATLEKHGINKNDKKTKKSFDLSAFSKDKLPNNEKLIKVFGSEEWEVINNNVESNC